MRKERNRIMRGRIHFVDLSDEGLRGARPCSLVTLYSGLLLRKKTIKVAQVSS